MKRSLKSKAFYIIIYLLTTVIINVIYSDYVYYNTYKNLIYEQHSLNSQMISEDMSEILEDAKRIILKYYPESTIPNNELVFVTEINQKLTLGKCILIPSKSQFISTRESIILVSQKIANSNNYDTKLHVLLHELIHAIAWDNFIDNDDFKESLVQCITEDLLVKEGYSTELKYCFVSPKNPKLSFYIVTKVAYETSVVWETINELGLDSSEIFRIYLNSEINQDYFLQLKEPF